LTGQQVYNRKHDASSAAPIIRAYSPVTSGSELSLEKAMQVWSVYLLT